jgi:hypothetical protein
MLIKSEEKEEVCELNKHSWKNIPSVPLEYKETYNSLLCHQIYTQLIYDIINILRC